MNSLEEGTNRRSKQTGKKQNKTPNPWSFVDNITLKSERDYFMTGRASARSSHFHTYLLKNFPVSWVPNKEKWKRKVCIRKDQQHPLKEMRLCTYTEREGRLSCTQSLDVVNHIMLTLWVYGTGFSHKEKKHTYVSSCHFHCSISVDVGE